jgi:hypothetical protein
MLTTETLLGSLRARILAIAATVISLLVFVSDGNTAEKDFAPRAGSAAWQPWLAEFLHADQVEYLKMSGEAETSSSWEAGSLRAPASAAWTEVALELVVKYQQNPLRAARALALTHAAMHDAVVLAARAGGSLQAREAAQHLAAGRTLAYLYPYEPTGRLEGLGIAAASLVPGSLDSQQLARASRAAEQAVVAAIARSRVDGAGRQWAPERRTADIPGRWRATPPLNIYNPAEPLAGAWRTWVLAHGGELQPPPPVSYDSARFWEEAEEVYRVSRRLTVEQRAIAERWNLDHGTVTPAGVWNRIALELVRSAKLDSDHAARVFAALNVAMMDAFIACWRTKFSWWTVRPVSAIRERFEPEFLPALVTPAFPSYVSGHATVSGAAASVLAAFFPHQAEDLSARAEEAASSRLLGGIHYRSDNDEGLKLGRQIGTRAVQRALGAPTTR